MIESSTHIGQHLECKELIFSDPTADGYPDPVQMEEARQREVIFRIERYGIVVFAIFFVVFNAYYWIHLLRSL